MTPPTLLLLGLALLQIDGIDAGAAPPQPEEPPPPAAPGEPVPDGSLPAGTLIVDLRDAEGKPVPRAEIVVESSDAEGGGRQLKTETDGNGRIRV